MSREMPKPAEKVQCDYCGATRRAIHMDVESRVTHKMLEANETFLNLSDVILQRISCPWHLDKITKHYG